MRKLTTAHKAIIGSAVALAAISAYPAWRLFVLRPRLDAEYQEQLRLARQEGLPTTGTEFAATLPKVSPEDNAAPFYSQMKFEHLKFREDAEQAIEDLIWSPGDSTQESAQALLQKNTVNTDLLAQAVQRPGCRFDRDWNLGAAVLFREYPQMKLAALLARLKGANAAANGEHDLAIRFIRESRVVGDHMRQESTTIGFFLSLAIEKHSIETLAQLALKYHSVSKYQAELGRMISDWKVPDLKAVYRFELVEILTIIDLCETPDGRDKLGLREDEVAPGELLGRAIQSQSVGRVMIVKAMRAKWAAYDTENPRRGQLIEAAKRERSRGLTSFLTASKILEGVGPGGPSPDLLDAHKAWKVQLQALHRALSQPKIPKLIETSDLLSPFDQRPVSYSYDGKAIVIEVSAPHNPWWNNRLRVGPPE